MGYVTDQDGIMTRYLREQQNWDEHLNKTKSFILSAFSNKPGGKLAVLGSGWLLDLPLEALTQKFDKIILVDVRHPAQVVKKAEKYKNVKLFETDLTGGGIDFCWERRKARDEHLSKYFLDEFEPEQPALPLEPDAFISLNILNQLDILLVDYLKKRNGRITESEITRFRKKIQQFHIDWITAKPGCLITDVLELNEDETGKTEQHELVFANLPGHDHTEEWTWNFDLSGKYHNGFKTSMKVKAFAWS